MVLLSYIAGTILCFVCYLKNETIKCKVYQNYCLNCSMLICNNIDIIFDFKIKV